MIKFGTDKKWKNTSGNNTTFGTPFSLAALKHLQSQVLDMAKNALNDVPIEERDQGTITFSIPTSLMPVAKEKIKKFRRELDMFFQKSGLPQDEIYQFTTSLYPVSRIRKSRKGMQNETR